MEKSFCFVTKNTEYLEEISSYIREILENKGFIYDEENPGVVLSLGGDGTFLKAADLYRNKRPIFLGINLGKLGFLCQFSESEIDLALECILRDDLRKYIKYPLIKIQHDGENYYALNEARIISLKGTSLSFDIAVDEEFLERLNADGLMVCSPLGSTGINKGLGGAIIDPTLNVLEICEITPINNKFYCSINSPLVINGTSLVSLDNFSSHSFNLYLDNRAIEMNDVNELLISFSDEYVLVLKNTNKNYIKKLNDSFIR